MIILKKKIFQEEKIFKKKNFFKKRNKNMKDQFVFIYKHIIYLCILFV